MADPEHAVLVPQRYAFPLPEPIPQQRVLQQRIIVPQQQVQSIRLRAEQPPAEPWFSPETYEFCLLACATLVLVGLLNMIDWWVSVHEG